MNAPFSDAGALPLAPHWGVIRARGADAVSFLQGQLTNDVATLGMSQARLAGFCSAKGRLQASFLVWKRGPDEVLLACSASVLPATLKRLSMFVMRAKCRLTDASAELPLWGAVGAAAQALMPGASVGQMRVAEHATHIRLADADGTARGLVMAHNADAPPAELAAWPTLTLAAWRLGEVRSGIPNIEAGTVDRFVPQMLNYELIGGVDFQKGCYPGQEVVARSQYRGTVKRRMLLFDVDSAAAPGQEVFHSGDAGQPAGMVVNAAPHRTGVGASALVEVKLAALQTGSLHLGTPDGALLRRRELPYEVPDVPDVPREVSADAASPAA
jgi:tRNA-modifying protein YgfZ